LRFCFSDDEGSEEDEDELGQEEEDDDDEDYHEAEEEQENEPPPTVPSQQQNGFQFGISKPEAVSGLSNMMAKFDFNFGLQPTTEVNHEHQTKANQWSTLNNLDKVKEYLKVNELVQKLNQLRIVSSFF
jgi:hypothetical protein